MEVLHTLAMTTALRRRDGDHPAWLVLTEGINVKENFRRM